MDCLFYPTLVIFLLFLKIIFVVAFRIWSWARRLKVSTRNALSCRNDGRANAGYVFRTPAWTVPVAASRPTHRHHEWHGHPELLQPWTIRQDVRPRCYNVQQLFDYILKYLYRRVLFKFIYIRNNNAVFFKYNFKSLLLSNCWWIFCLCKVWPDDCWQLRLHRAARHRSRNDGNLNQELFISFIFVDFSWKYNGKNRMPIPIFRLLF